MGLCALEAIVEVAGLVAGEVALGQIDLLSTGVAEQIQSVSHTPIQHGPLLWGLLEVQLVQLVAPFDSHKQ